jgi:uncharacterized membrane protein YdjX (TVP38/TMEM64 family)
MYKYFWQTWNAKAHKKETFSHILQKVKTYFMSISIILRLIPCKFQYININWSYVIRKY